MRASWFWFDFQIVKHEDDEFRAFKNLNNHNVEDSYGYIRKMVGNCWADFPGLRSTGYSNLEDSWHSRRQHIVEHVRRGCRGPNFGAALMQ